MRGQHDDAKFRVAIAEVPGQPQAVAVGQGSVDGHDVRAHQPDRGCRLGGRAALGDNLDVWVPRDELAQAIPGQCVAVDNAKANLQA